VATSNQFAYVQARLQARHGQRPSEDRWRLLESSPDLASYLQGARSTSLRPWVVHLPAESSTHQVERSLRIDCGTRPFPTYRSLSTWCRVNPYPAGCGTTRR
jgi:hypothetical protein